MSERCAPCRGAGNLFCAQAGTYEWWPCPACGGAGVRQMYGPPTVKGDNARHWKALPKQGGKGQ